MKSFIYITLFLFISSKLHAAPRGRAYFDQINEDFLMFINTYKPSGVKVSIFANWAINYPAASTERSTDFEITRDRSPIEWDISILSGYFQDSDGGHDVHLLALCHEMAHHLGGAPYKLDDEGNERWASMEAQSDYWATQFCIPQFLKKYPRYLIQRVNIHPEIKRLCSREYYTWFSNYKYCIFSSQAAYQMGKIHDKNRLPSEPITEPVNPETPDPTIVDHLDRNIYPSNQCRFDTCFAGALGKERPRCWYPEKLN